MQLSLGNYTHESVTQNAIIRMSPAMEAIRDNRKVQIMALLSDGDVMSPKRVAKRLGLTLHVEYIRGIMIELYGEGRVVYDPFVGYKSTEAYQECE